MFVRLGEHDITDPSDIRHQDLGLARVTVHEEYSPPAAYHDIALIQLDRPVNLRVGYQKSVSHCLCLGKKVL